MAAVSMATLPPDAPLHSAAQRAHVQSARAMYERIAGCPLRASAVTPAEGWLADEAEHWFDDPMGTARAQHDVVPDGGATTRQQAALVAARLRAAIAREGLPSPDDKSQSLAWCDQAVVGGNVAQGRPGMTIVIENYVHTSYLAPASVPAAAPASREALGPGKGILLFCLKNNERVLTREYDRRRCRSRRSWRGGPHRRRRRRRRCFARRRSEAGQGRHVDPAAAAVAAHGAHGPAAQQGAHERQNLLQAAVQRD
jgi:hypothetical protein